MEIETHGYALTSVGRELERYSGLLRAEANEVIIKVAGCGVCHTDVSFAKDGVPTRHPLPLVLGHEISGRVVACGEGAAEWMDQDVLVPAVIPCETCAACRAGRSTICRNQFMPGNDGNGGFATHLCIPARGLCRIPRHLPAGLSVADLSVVADAVTTPFEAIKRSGLCEEDIAIFVGVGGVGGFGVQIAAAYGAAVVAIDVDADRLELATAHGADLALQAGELRETKRTIREFKKKSGRRGIGYKIFETSGTSAGQQTAFGLMDHGAHLSVVGYTKEKSPFRLSNLMALDAVASGNWGCPPERYPKALALVLEGKVALAPFVERHDLEDAPAVLEAVAAHSIKKRPILVPRD